MAKWASPSGWLPTLTRPRQKTKSCCREPLYKVGKTPSLELMPATALTAPAVGPASAAKLVVPVPIPPRAPRNRDAWHKHVRQAHHPEAGTPHPHPYLSDVRAHLARRQSPVSLRRPPASSKQSRSVRRASRSSREGAGRALQGRRPRAGRERPATRLRRRRPSCAPAQRQNSQRRPQCRRPPDLRTRWGRLVEGKRARPPKTPADVATTPSSETRPHHTR